MIGNPFSEVKVSQYSSESRQTDGQTDSNTTTTTEIKDNERKEMPSGRHKKGESKVGRGEINSVRYY